MELIIGREQGNRKLKVTKDGKTTCFGSPNSVSMGVSRQHCKIEVQEDGTIRLTNLNPLNVTFVDNRRINSITITENSKIELSEDRYLLDIATIIQSLIPKYYSISHLKKIEEEYEKNINSQSYKNTITSVILGSGFLFTMIGGVASSLGFSGGVLFTIISAIIMIISAVYKIKSVKPNQEKTKQLKEEYHNKYVCPKCNVFIPMSYDILRQRKKCPYCGANFNE